MLQGFAEFFGQHPGWFWVCMLALVLVGVGSLVGILFGPWWASGVDVGIVIALAVVILFVMANRDRSK